MCYREIMEGKPLTPKQATARAKEAGPRSAKNR
jgi:hypothetical protein